MPNVPAKRPSHPRAHLLNFMEDLFKLPPKFVA